MDPLNKIVLSLPESIRKLLSNTSVKKLYDFIYNSTVYNQLRYRLSNKVQYNFKTAVGNFQLYLPESSDGVITSKADLQGGYEPGLCQALADVLGPDDIVFDIGGGFGYNAALAQTTGVPPDQIHVFEADALRILYCQKNNPRCHMIPRFVGDGHGNSYAIDHYVSSSKTPSVVLMDIEGAEIDALNGLTETLRNYHPTLFIEIHPDLLTNRNLNHTELFSILQGHGYDIAVKNHRRRESEWSYNIQNPELSSQAYTRTYLLRATTPETHPT